MSFIAKLFSPKPPPAINLIMPKVEDVPEVDSPEDKAREAEEMRRSENKRMGRRSTIEDEISKKTLLG